MITQNITKLSVLLMLRTFVHLAMHPQNFVYLSVVINHRTKEIESWELSMYNDAKLIIDSFAAIEHKLAGSIVHTDHGADYISKSYQSMLRKHHATQSMSRVANSLDNRDIEFWFSIFKTELIYRLDIKRMLFVQLRQAIADYIYYYNNLRIQKNWTGWHQFNIKINYNKKHEIWIFVQISCSSLFNSKFHVLI